MDCLFCAIAEGAIPSKKVYEDDVALVFHDIAPAAPVHVIIAPKEHIPSALDINRDNSAVVGHIYEVAAALAAALEIDRSGFRIVNNCGEDGGQTVGHLHFHLMGGRVLGIMG